MYVNEIYLLKCIYQVIYFCNSEKFFINSLSLLFSFRLLSTLLSLLKVNNYIKYICLTSLTRAKCGTRSTLCWKNPNISGSIKLFAL